MNPLTSNSGPDRDADLDTILSIVPFLLIGLSLLFLPTLIAIARKHEHRNFILLINS